MIVQYIKRGLYNTLCYGASSLIARVISFFFLPYFLSNLTLHDFGMWDFYQLLFSWGTLILSSCSSMAIIRYYLMYMDEHIKQKQTVGNACASVIVACILGLIIIMGLLWLFNGTSDEYFFVGATAINVTLYAFFTLVLSYLRIKESLKLYMLLFCGQNGIAVVLTIYGISQGAGISSFFYGNGISYLLFVPSFIYLMMYHWDFSWEIFKDQVKYTVPLLIASILYMGFFTIDRLFIKNYSGYESLGMYALIWRFGALFQFFSVALFDAWVIILLNAHNELENNRLISKLTTYFCIVLATGSLGAIVLSNVAINWLLPAHHSIIGYLPCFFLSLGLLEIARLMGSGFTLAAKKTWLLSLITVVSLLIQVVAASLFYSFGLWGIMLGNCVAFASYGVVRHAIGYYVYPHEIVDVRQVISVIALFLFFVVCYQLLFTLTVPWYLLCLFWLLWPVSLWLLEIIESGEKEVIVAHCLEFLLPRIKKIEEQK